MLVKLLVVGELEVLNVELDEELEVELEVSEGIVKLVVELLCVLVDEVAIVTIVEPFEGPRLEVDVVDRLEVVFWLVELVVCFVCVP